MAVTLQQLMESHTRMREMAASDSPMESALNRIVDVLEETSSGIMGLQKALDAKTTANTATRLAGESSDMRDALKKFLKVQADSDKLAREREERIVGLVQTTVPQVTEEQLKAVRAQQLAYREHRKTMQATLDTEKRKFDLQKKREDDLAKRRIATLEKQRADEDFAIKDKYGTVGSALGGLGSKAQDPLSRFLVGGLQRYVSERKEAPVAKAVKDKYDEAIARRQGATDSRKVLLDATYNTRREDIEEEFSVRAARDNVFDPGSATKLYEARTRYVQALVSQGVKQELSLLNKPVQKMVSATKSRQDIPGTGGNSRDIPDSNGAPSRVAVTPVKPAGGSAPMTELPEGTRIARASSPRRGPSTRRAIAQRTPMHVSGAHAVASSASGGMFGSKAGFVDLGGSGKALAGIAGNVGKLAGSATKFLGPWALVANALMAVDRLVPVISDGAGALMDLTKLVMPMAVSTTAEGFAQVLGGINGLINLFDRSMFGRKWYKDTEAQNELSIARKVESARMARQAESRRQVTAGGASIMDTTSAPSRSILRDRTPVGRGASITLPMDTAGAPATVQTAPTSSTRTPDMELVRALQTALSESNKSPGTTPVMMTSPVMTPWFV